MKKNKELITIIVPIYNCEKHIKKCLESIINQTYQNIEILLINDGSTDNTLKIIDKIKKNDDRIRVINKANEGVAKTRNMGIKLAKGKYIMFIDNDDYIDINYVEKFYKEILDDNYDMVVGGYKRVNDKKTLFIKKLKKNNWSKYEISAPWAKIYKKNVLTRLNAEFLNYKMAEDNYFSLFLYTNNLRIKTIEYVGYNWYYNPNSVSNTKQKGFSNEINVIYLLNEFLSLDNSKNKEKGLFYYYIYRFTYWYLLFSGKDSTPAKFMEEHQSITEWKNLHIKNKIKIPKEETIKNKFIIKTMIFIERIGIIKLFSQIYCRNR